MSENNVRKENRLPSHAGKSVRMSVQILFWMAVTALVPLAVAFWLVHEETGNAVAASERKHLASAAEAKKAQIQAWLVDIRSEIVMISSDVCVMNCSLAPGFDPAAGGMAAGCSRRLDIARREPYYRWVGMYDAKLGLRTVSAREGETGALPGALQRGLASAEGYAESLSTEKDGRTYLYAGCPIRDSELGVSGYIVVKIDLNVALERIFAGRESLGETGRITLDTPDGRRLAASPAATGTGTGETPPPRLTAVTTVQPAGWKLTVSLDESEAMALLRTINRHALFFFLPTALLVLGLALHLSRRLARPLRRLAETAQRVASGQHHTRVPTGSGVVEAESLARAFNAMMDAVEASHRRLVHVASLAAVGELSSSVAHEIRNPLSTILLNLEAFATKLADDPVHAELCALAMDQARRMDRMISDLLNYAKPLDVQLEDIRWEELSAGAVRAVEAPAREKAVTVERNDRLGNEPFRGDPELLERLLVNLLLNAVLFTRNGGKVRLDGARENGWVVFTVEDEGPGIVPAAMGRLFQPFFTTRDQGTGLGLANVRRIAEYHGGDVTAENLPRSGARFSVRIPAHGVVGRVDENPGD